MPHKSTIVIYAANKETMKPFRERNTSKASLCDFSKRQGNEISTSQSIGFPPMTMALELAPATSKTMTRANVLVGGIISLIVTMISAGSRKHTLPHWRVTRKNLAPVDGFGFVQR
ncbi:unnamed protein product [Choristocarpus tenellus]